MIIAPPTVPSVWHVYNNRNHPCSFELEKCHIVLTGPENDVIINYQPQGAFAASSVPSAAGAAGALGGCCRASLPWLRERGWRTLQGHCHTGQAEERLA